MINVVIKNTDEAYPEDRAELNGITVIVLAVTEDGISVNASGYITPDLLNSLKKDFPKVIDKLKKEMK